MIPQVVKRATIAIEDRRFYEHGALDYQGIVRAAIKDALKRRQRPTGRVDADDAARRQHVPARTRTRPTTTSSTRSSRPSWPSSSRTSTRRTGSSTSYLNDVPYGTVGGQTAYGVGAASQMFFDKPVQKLNLAQAALLAGLPQAPSQYNPFIDAGAARQRRARGPAGDGHRRLHHPGPGRRGRDASTLEVKPDTLLRRPQAAVRVRLHRAAAVAHDLCPKTPNHCAALQQGGLKIYTTIDLRKQALAQQAILDTRVDARRAGRTRPGRRRRWPRSTPTTATSWRSRRRRTTARRRSTTPPRPTGSRARRSRCSR